MAQRGEAVLGRTNAKTTFKIYIACEEMNYFWTEADLMMFRHLWKTGESLAQIAEYFRRDPDEVVILIIDQAKKGLIDPRREGIGAFNTPRESTKRKSHVQKRKSRKKKNESAV